MYKNITFGHPQEFMAQAVGSGEFEWAALRRTHQGSGGNGVYLGLLSN
jgi:hypothetical protein